MVHIIYLLAAVVIRLVRINLRRYRVAERVSHHLRRTATLHLAIKLIWLTNGTFLYLHLLILGHMRLLRLHHAHSLRSLAVHIEILTLLLIWSCLPHHWHVMLIEPGPALMPWKLSVVAIHHALLLRLRLLLRLTIMTSKINYLDRKIILWTWLGYILGWEGRIFKRSIIWVWVESQLIVPGRLHVICLNWCAVLVVLAAHGLLVRDRHIFGVCLLRKHLIFVHKLMIYQRRSKLLSLWSKLLYLRQVVLHFLEVCVVKLTVLVEIRTLLAVTEDEIGYFL